MMTARSVGRRRPAPPLRGRKPDRPTGTLRHPVLVTLPFIVIVSVGLLIPLVVDIWDSFRLPTFSLEPYLVTFREPVIYQSIIRTFVIAACVTVITVTLGYVLAIAAWRASGRRGALLLLIVCFPLLTSLVTRTYAWVLILGRNGPVNGLLQWLGITSQPIKFLDSSGAVIVGMVHVMIPFVVLPIYNILRKIHPSLLQASAALGASGRTTFRRIILPLSASGGIVGGVFVFVLSLGFYITPAVLGGPTTMMVANTIDRQANFYLAFDTASAIAVELLVVTLLLLGLLASRYDLTRAFKR